MQVLEGERDALRQLYGVIAKDARRSANQATPQPAHAATHAMAVMDDHKRRLSPEKKRRANIAIAGKARRMFGFAICDLTLGARSYSLSFRTHAWGNLHRREISAALHHSDLAPEVGREFVPIELSTDSFANLLFASPMIRLGFPFVVPVL